MRHRILAVLVTGLVASAAAAQATGAPPDRDGRSASPLAGARDVRSYALGLDLGRALRDKLVDVDPATLSQGILDALEGREPRLTDEQVRAAISDLQADRKRRVAEARGTGSKENRETGDAFRAENGKKAGVVTLPSGLQYRVLRAGDGPRPTRGDTVLCRYRGTLVDGLEFDASSDHGEAASLPVAGVIAGWSQALQLMPVGSRWQLVVPPELAYGSRGAGKVIGPDATLVFDVELVAIHQPSPTAAAGSAHAAAE